jgi:hypothetical protein
MEDDWVTDLAWQPWDGGATSDCLGPIQTYNSPHFLFKKPKVVLMVRIDEPLIPKRGYSFQYRRSRGILVAISFATFLVAFYVMLLSTQQSSMLFGVAQSHYNLLPSLALESGCKGYTDASVGISVE